MGTKDSGLRLRVERSLRQAFLEACREDDKPAAQVLREFMRSYIAGRKDITNTPLAIERKQMPERRRHSR